MKKVVILAIALIMALGTATPVMALTDTQFQSGIVKAVKSKAKTYSYTRSYTKIKAGTNLYPLKTKIEESYPSIWYLSYIDTWKYNRLPYSNKYTLYMTYSQANLNSISQKDNKFNNDVNRLTKNIKGKTEYATIKNAYTWVAKNVKYSTSSQRAWDAYGALEERKAACIGYSRLARVLMNRNGIQTRGVNCKPLNHYWFQVKYKGVWYNCDPTWDRAEIHSGKVAYNYFMKTNANFKNHKTYAVATALKKK